ncbi:hypothetical protein D0Z00_004641 [Geotrichum galactomycetum]|uniref:Uncharacterized protein n=1 Tax=Geotrichum galactomycetum TaxID=27317 RepID=A0ACB6UXU5_9ASCO|nr:hypothetical protein D0Z00_004641 [Geotrichum candidum]
MLNYYRSSRLVARQSQALRGFATSSIVKNGSQEHVFTPLATQSVISPMRRNTTWLTALRAREKQKVEWIAKHKDELLSGKLRAQDLPLESYSYTKVGTLEVAERSPKDSFSYVILPFKSDEWFLDAYINAYGRLRIGQIFQDLDALAGVIAYKHCNPAQPVIVTASVDRIYMKKRLDSIANLNITLSGNVTWTGRSSMEITIKAATNNRDLTVDSKLTKEDIKEEDIFLTANFTFVARNPETKKSFAINKLVPTTDQEHADFVRAEKYNKHKREEASKSALIHTPPSEEESDLVHKMWLQQRLDPDKASSFADATSASEILPVESPADQISVQLMQETRISSTSMMQPQYRNRHSYMIFGGYLLRQTFELAYACASAFSHDIPRFVSLDSTTFRNPVPVGSVLYLTATVVYTEFINRKLNPEAGDKPDERKYDFNQNSIPGTLIQVRVDSTVRDLKHGTTTNTGQFTYSYFVAANAEKSVIPGNAEDDKPKFYSVMPQTYSEMMEYLEGRRKSLDTASFNTYVRLMPNPNEVVSE